MAQPPDEELVAYVRQGDQAAFEVLVRRHERMVFNIAWRMLRNREDAEDAAQEAFLRAFRSIETFRGQAKFSSWLYRITVNFCLSALESATASRRLVHLSDDLDTDNTDLAAKEASPEQIAGREDFAERIRALVDDLPPKYRAVLTLYYLQDRSYLQVAEILDIPLGSVKVQLHRAKNLLRNKVLEQYQLEELL